MDPDSGSYLKSSNITKIALLTFLFTACYFYKTRQRASDFKHTEIKKDSSSSFIAKEKKPVLKKKKKKTIYLSFDDGPNKGTQNVMDIINQEEIDATLFIVGEHVYGSRKQKDLYDSILGSRYVEIANHSYTHAFHNRFSKFYSLPDSVVRDFERCADSLHLSSNIIRTPGRNIWRLKNIIHNDLTTSNAAADSLQKKAYAIMGWDLEWFYDADLKALQTTQQMVTEVDSMFVNNKNKTKGHMVLLAHDQVFRNSKDSASLHQLIIALKESGEYDFAMVKNYPELYKNFKTDSIFNKK